MFPLDISACYTNGVFTAQSPLPCRRSMQRKQAVQRQAAAQVSSNREAVQSSLSAATNAEVGLDSGD